MSHGVQRYGARGNDVLALQQALQRAGKDPGPLDGVFGKKTEAAVKALQREHGLSTDGIAGPKTWKVLDGFDTPKPQTPRNDGDSFDIGKTGAIGDIPKSGNAFIARVAADAILSQRETGVPASVTLAQAILESGWGKSGLSTKAHNYFGIKGEGPAGHVVMRTREVFNGKEVYIADKFRKYNSPAESFSDHGMFLVKNKRYAKCFNYKNDAEQFAREIQKAGYATDPNYANALIKLIRQYDLTRYDKIATGG